MSHRLTQFVRLLTLGFACLAPFPHRADADIFDVPGALRRLAQQEAQNSRTADRHALTPPPKIAPQGTEPSPPRTAPQTAQGTASSPLLKDPTVTEHQAEAAHYYHSGVVALMTGDAKQAAHIARHLETLEGAAAANGEAGLFAASLSIRIHLQQNKSDLAEKQRDALPDFETLKRRSFSCQLAAAEAFAAFGPAQAPKALECYNHVGQTSHALPRVLAAEGMSDTYLGINDFDRAYDWIRFAILSLDDMPKAEQASTRHAYDFRDELPIDIASGHRDRLIRKRDEIEMILAVMRYGLGYAIYEGAQKARYAGRHDQAIDLYDQLIELSRKNRHSQFTVADLLKERPFNPESLLKLPISEVYVEASTIYRLHSLHGARRSDEAVPGLVRYTRNNPFRLYTAEAYTLLGDIALQESHAPKTATRYYTQAIEWCQSIQKSDHELARFQVPGQAARVTAPPAEMKAYSGWNNLNWQKPKPGAIFNRKTSEWYLPYRA